MLQVVHSLGGIAGIQGAGNILADIRIKIVNRQGCGLAIRGNVPRSKGNGYLLCSILTVHHNLVACNPLGLSGDAGCRKLEGKSPGFGLYLYFLVLVLTGVYRIHLPATGGEKENRTENKCGFI